LVEPRRPGTLLLRACDRFFTIECKCEPTMALLQSVFSALVHPGDVDLRPVRRYVITVPDQSGCFVISDGTRTGIANGADNLLYQIDKAITVALQLDRPDLFFLHAATIAVNGRAVAMPAFPGTGKSTLTLALAEHGLEYLSDELAPVDLERLTVAPYPHAVCLKSAPPPPYDFPQGTLTVNRRFQVPVASLASTTRLDPLPLAGIVFLRRDASRFDGLRPISTASGATHLMAHLLNGLAHPNYGLDSAIALSDAVPCFELDVTDLPAAVQAIAEM
jgi:hypothetical protein